MSKKQKSLSDIKKNHRMNEIRDALEGGEGNQDLVAEAPKMLNRANPMVVAVEAIHLLSGEVTEKDRAIAGLIQDGKQLRVHLRRGHRKFRRARLMLDAVLTLDGQKIVREINDIKDKDKATLNKVNHKILQQLREYLADK